MNGKRKKDRLLVTWSRILQKGLNSDQFGRKLLVGKMEEIDRFMCH